MDRFGGSGSGFRSGSATLVSKSVAEGSGAFLSPGSGIQKSRSRIPRYIPDLMFENLGSVFWVKNTLFFDADRDPVSGILLTMDRDPGWKKSDPLSGINIPDPHHLPTG